MHSTVFQFIYVDFFYFLYLVNFVLFRFFFSCPEGQRRLGATQCIDEDECEYPDICLNGGTCINLSDRNHFRCACPPSWDGRYCEQPAPPAVVLVGGKDFIIVFVFCVISLLSKYLSHFCRFLVFITEGSHIFGDFQSVLMAVVIGLV